MILEIESYKENTTTFTEVTNAILDKDKNQLLVIGIEVKTLYLEENDRVRLYDNGVKLFSYKCQTEKQNKKD